MASRGAADPELAELRRLRALAFGPGGTDADVAAFLREAARLGAHPRVRDAARDALGSGDRPIRSAAGAEPASVRDGERDAPAGDARARPPHEAPPTAPASPPRRGAPQPRSLAALAIASGLALLAVGTAIGAAAVRDDRPRPALGVFQAPAEPGAPESRYAERISAGGPEGAVPEDRVRWLRVVPGGDLFAVLGTVFRRGGTESHLAVCLVMERDGSGLVKCSTLDEFATDGVRLRSGELDVRWGPTDDEPVVLDAAGIRV